MGRIVQAWLGGGSDEGLTAFRFEFNSPLGAAPISLLLFAAAAMTAFYFWPRLNRLSRPARVTMTVLRVAVILLVLFLFFDPCLVGQRIRPGEHYVVVLLDDSKSMQITGEDDLSRADRLRKAWEADGGEFERRLGEKYQVALYRFGGEIERIHHLRDLQFDENETSIVGSIEKALADLEGLHVSGVIVLSDGVEQVDGPPPILDRFDSGAVPIFTVDVGSDAPWRDIELGNLSVRRTNFDQSPVVVTVPVVSTGQRGGKAVIEVMDGEDRVAMEELAIEEDHQDNEVRLEFVPDRENWIDYKVSVRLTNVAPNAGSRAAPGDSNAGLDRVAQNNSRHFIVDNRKKEYRILYFAGRPNWENKFINRALAEDNQLKLTRLIRISKAEKKFVFRGKRTSLANPLFDGFEFNRDQPRYDEAVFLRYGVKGHELEKGYPSRPEDIFPFHLVILGDIEYNFFSQSQLRATLDFVRKRGGGLLMIGGPYSFTEGQYGGSILESMLPVLLRESPPGPGKIPSNLLSDFKAVPTLDGLLAGSWALDPNPDENRRLWDRMPGLEGLNDFIMTRAGATVLARVQSADKKIDRAPLFATQRYGEGKVAILSTATTWQFQMKNPIEDQSHERLWRQIVRSLVNDRPEPVMLRNLENSYVDSRPIPFEMVLRDKLYDEREGLKTEAVIKLPSGVEVAVPVEESIHESGVYTMEYQPAETGMHRINVVAEDDKGVVVGRLNQAFLVEEDQCEFRRAQFDPSWLRRIARKTGGRYFSIDHLPSVVDAIPWTDRTRRNEVRFHLWHFPAFFFMLIGLMAIDWSLRRKKGYA